MIMSQEISQERELINKFTARMVELLRFAEAEWDEAYAMHRADPANTRKRDLWLEKMAAHTTLFRLICREVWPLKYQQICLDI